jgi:putative glutamine amidotransferase
MKAKLKKSSKNSRLLKILVPFDFLPEIGFFLKPDLVAALQKPGIHIIPLLYDEGDLKKKVAEADGLLIPGGVGDVDPQLYDQKKRHECVHVIRERADFEFKLLDLFIPTEKPLLAICWGHQILNVFLGGTLIQDLKRDRPSHINHEQKEPGHIATHHVRFESNSPALKIFGEAQLKVNSTHHQAVDKLSRDLICEGVSEDGLVECMQIKKHAFAWGVQWHPERLKGDLIIPKFFKACKAK